MNKENKNLGGFFVIDLLTHRIIKEHKHMNTAITHAKKIGLDKAIVKPIADREAWLIERKLLGHHVPY